MGILSPHFTSYVLNVDILAFSNYLLAGIDCVQVVLASLYRYRTIISGEGTVGRKVKQPSFRQWPINAANYLLADLAGILAFSVPCKGIK